MRKLFSVLTLSIFCLAMAGNIFAAEKVVYLVIPGCGA